MRHFLLRHSRPRGVLLVWPAIFILLALPASGQQRYVRGQNVQPVFEGWDRNADGTYNLHFGYLNRNWEESPVIPVGEDNGFSPGPADRGQPTRFYARRQQTVFTVTVPSNFGKQELVWTVKHNGRTDRAVAWLAPFYEFDNTIRRAQRSGTQRQSTQEELNDKPPSIELDGPAALQVKVDTPLSLAVLVRDDGLPGSARSFRFANEGGAADEAFRQPSRPSFPDQDRVSARSASRTGLAVTWLHYRGPADVAFEPVTSPLEKMGGRGSTIARFSVPGTYVVRAVANDQIFTVPVDVTVTVVP